VCGRRTPPFTCCGHRWCRHRRVVAAAVAAAAAAAAAATTTAVDRKEARVVRARAHALPRMRIERDQSLFLPPVGGVSARVVLAVAATVDATVDAISDDAEVMLTSHLLMIARTRRFSGASSREFSALLLLACSSLCFCFSSRFRSIDQFSF